eukprot:scaffold27180_cov64-Phaeocystis_antarctica.AAC.4
MDSGDSGDSSPTPACFLDGCCSALGLSFYVFTLPSGHRSTYLPYVPAWRRSRRAPPSPRVILPDGQSSAVSPFGKWATLRASAGPDLSLPLESRGTWAGEGCSLGLTAASLPLESRAALLFGSECVSATRSLERARVARWPVVSCGTIKPYQEALSACGAARRRKDDGCVSLAS